MRIALRRRALRRLPVRRPAFAGVLVASIASLASLAVDCRDSDKEGIETEAPVPVEVQAARKGTIQGIVVATGVVVPAPGAEQDVTAPQPARIAELPKALGDVVRRGDLLVRFDIPSLRSEAAARASDRAQAEARLETARQAHSRASALLERGIAARREVEESRKALKEAEAALNQAGAAVAAVDQLSARATVSALFDGIVSRRSHNPGELVDASGDPILRIIDPTRLEVEAGVPFADVGRFRPGQRARILPPASSGEASATVRSRPAAIDPATGTASVRLGFDGPPRFPAGTPVRVEIQAEERSGVVVVPASALVREGSKASVFVVGADKHAHRRDVSIGIESTGEVEVVSGVAEGESVVVKGQRGLPDGAAVAPGS